MAQEEHGAVGGGGGRSKKSKPQKKAPQRGLGVAQLEKIISEEKQKKDLILGRINGPYMSNDVLVAAGGGGGGGGLIGPCHENGPKSWVGPMRSLQLFQRPPPPSSSCSSLVRSSQMELPSIQSFHCKNYYALTEEDKMMIGMKRPHSSFSLQSPQSSSLQSKSEEPASCTNNEQYTPPMEPRNKKLIRESVSNSSLLNNERLNGDFLTLAPPAVESPPLDYLGHHRHELSENEYIPGQEYGESNIRGPGPSGLVEKSFSFFPIKLQGYQTSAYVSNGEKGETIDLNLKL